MLGNDLVPTDTYALQAWEWSGSVGELEELLYWAVASAGKHKNWSVKDQAKLFHLLAAMCGLA